MSPLDPDRHREFERALRERLAIDASDSDAADRLAELLHHQERFDGLCHLLARQRELRPTEWSPHVRHGRALLLAGREDEGLDALRSAVASFPTEEDAWAALVHALIEREHLDEARDVVDRALAAMPGSAEAWNLDGIALYRAGQFREAIESYDRALDLSSRPERRAVFRVHRANALDMEGRVEEAVADYEAARVEDPDCLMATLNLGIALAKAGRTFEALRPLAEAEVLGVEDPRLVRVYGYVLYKERRHREAIALARRVLERRPQDAEALVVLGRSHHELGDHREAIAAMQHALAFNPDAVEAAERLSVLLVEQGDADGARAVLRAAIERQPESPGLRYNAASLARRDGALEEARAHAEAGLEVAPGHTLLALLGATIFEALGDRDAGRRALLQAITLSLPSLAPEPLPDAPTPLLACGDSALVAAAALDHLERHALSSLRFGEVKGRLLLGVPGQEAVEIRRVDEDTFAALALDDRPAASSPAPAPAPAPDPPAG